MKNRINRYITLQWDVDGVFWVGLDKFIHRPDGSWFVYRGFRKINDGYSLRRFLRVASLYPVFRVEFSRARGRFVLVASSCDFDLWRGVAVDRSSVSSFEELLRLSADNSSQEQDV
jgi:hypothetical protein